MVSPEVSRQPHQTVSTHHFNGKDGGLYHVNYYNFPGVIRDDSRKNLDHPRFAQVKPNLSEMIHAIFPNYDEKGVASTVAKFDSFSRFAIAFTAEGKPVGFNIYKMEEVKTDAGKAKIIYVDHAGTDPEYRQTGITKAMRNEFFKNEQPDIICGSSANGAIYLANEGIAQDQGMAFYPTGAETPAPIAKLANQIHDAVMGLRNAELDNRLVRTYDSPTSRGDIEHPLQAELPLKETQHIFYMLVKPELNAALTNTTA